MQETRVSFSNTDRAAYQPGPDDRIVLTTLNARYIHASLGLRYLLANAGGLQKATTLVEFTINQRAIDIAEQLIQLKPKVIGFGVYIWNVAETTELVALIKKIRPDIKIIIGGPEVSHEYENTALFGLCDFLITGQADVEFGKLCERILANEQAIEKVTSASTPAVNMLQLPYVHYSEEDINNRVIYIEASRGCPFKCEFCLSALDKTAYPFSLDNLLAELDTLHSRGARQFKFVDRTFNLKIETCATIMQFFLTKINQGSELFLHFEVIPDRLPAALQDLIKQFPPGSLQFEIGIQSFNTAVQETISRKQNIDATINNLQWLHQHAEAHIHADLIFGLPGETLDTFADGFDQLIKLKPNEIQVGILKRLRGSPIIRHTDTFKLCFADNPPYQLLQNRDIDFPTMQRVQRFARYWDLIANSGRFRQTLPMLLGTAPFQRFMTLSDWLFDTTGQTHKIAYNRLLALVLEGAVHNNLADAPDLHQSLAADCVANGDAHPPRWLRDHIESLPDLSVADSRVTIETAPIDSASGSKQSKATPSRQRRHLAH